MKRRLFLIFAALCLVGAATADSIWNEKESASPYSTEKGYRLGDIVNIIILENTTAQNRAGTKTDIRDDLSAKLNHTIAKLAPIIGASNSLTGQAANKYQGLGQTSRDSSVQARISAWVKEVLPNGNLRIEGHHRVQVNNETQDITITGLVRPKDISGANTIFSYQVADAELTVQGTGVVAETESPGWLVRFINWLF
ncbi:flagellar basal body L-ring protein FlgH [Candidatus Saganbacteria bacterium]|nr:flagellar basal body L-ring protein FlgH [Candidatus Saganbacteria bacterium]